MFVDRSKSTTNVSSLFPCQEGHREGVLEENQVPATPSPHFPLQHKVASLAQQHLHFKVEKTEEYEYRGFWKNNLYEGEGTMEYNNGDIYIGHYHLGKREGYGLFVRINGHDGNGKARESRYIGHWKEDRRHGLGYQKYYTGDSFMGEWEEDKRKSGFGYGIINLNKSQHGYTGEWENFLPDGQGVCVYSDRSRYSGQWKNGERDGKGTMVWRDRTVYKGEWKEDKREGHGVMSWCGPNRSEIRRYEGEWKDSKEVNL